ncbi:MAG: hypothetical protein M0027_02080 [Candidatus Dormibacteraeota bacterium]|nr:hypothetical protein [Candidatus Dormibacteraeota bacterium]
MGRGDGIGEGFAFLILVAGVVAILVLVAWWVFCIVSIFGALLGWVWGMWKGDEPGEAERAWRRPCAPLWHYPFIGAGSVIASMAGAVAMHEIVRGADPALPLLVLVCVLARSLSMAWFPRPRARLVGLRVFPWVAVTGPLSSALGMLAVWVLVLGGQTMGHARDHWLAMTSVPGAIAISLVATGIGRLGRTLVPRSASFRLDILALLAPEAVAIGQDLALWGNPHQLGRVEPCAAQDPSEGPVRSRCLHGDRFIPPMGPAQAPWAAFRPSVRLNWRRLLGLPVGPAVGAGAGMLVAVVYRSGPPLAPAVGLLAAVWVWLTVVVGPLLCTLLYIDGDWVGERGLWRRCGWARADLGLVVRTAGGIFLEARDTYRASRSGGSGSVRLRLRWSREQLATLAGEMPAVNYGIWRDGADGDRTWGDLASDPAPLPHLPDPRDIQAA